MLSLRLVVVVVLTMVRAALATGSRIVPPLFDYDDYGRCRQATAAGVYCFVKVVLRTTDADPFATSRIVVDYRRDLLSWGLCMADCEKEVDSAADDRRRLYQPKFAINFTYIFPTEYWGDYLEPFRLRYSDLANVCVNKRLEVRHGSGHRGYTEIEYCTAKDVRLVDATLDQQQDAFVVPLRICFYVVFVALVSAVLGATWVDRSGVAQKYKGNTIVSSFSIPRNWNRLTAASNSDFAYLDGLRVFLCTAVIVTHYLGAGAMIPKTNPEYSEGMLKNWLTLDFTSALVIAVQIFFTISGLLLTIGVLKDLQRKKAPFSLRDMFAKIGNRFIRLLPVYYFFLIVSYLGEDLVPGVELGVLGHRMVRWEQGRCRNNWWMNTLFVNNLPFFEKDTCFLHGWYLAADVQLFIAALVLFAIISRYPKSARVLLWSCAICSVLLSTGIAYFLGLESTFPVRLSEYQFDLRYEPWLLQMYTPGYTNANCYIAGIIVGYIYHQKKHNKLNPFKSSLFNFLASFRLPMLFLAYAPPFLFYIFDVSRPSWWTTLHFVVFRNAAVIFASWTFLDCLQSPPGCFRRFLCSKLMTTLGRISYSVYISHIPVMMLVSNWFSPMEDRTLPQFGMHLAAGLVLLHFLGFVVYLCIEQPLRLLLTDWCSGARHSIKIK